MHAQLLTRVLHMQATPPLRTTTHFHFASPSSSQPSILFLTLNESSLQQTIEEQHQRPHLKYFLPSICEPQEVYTKADGEVR